MNERIDFQEVRRISLMYMDSFLDTHLPGGRREGHEYVVRNPIRPDNSPGSFKINMTNGAWSDFATGDAGGDLISLHAYISDIPQLDAAKYLLGLYGGTAMKPGRGKKSGKRAKWTPILPVPEDAPEPIRAHFKFGPYVRRWPFKDRIGRVNSYDCRFERINSKGKRVKDVLPLTYCMSDDGRQEWRFHSMPEPRPLYALDHLAKHPDLPVLVVEGGKCAEAAQEVMGGRYVVTTNTGGSNAVNKADWSPLSGRKVIIWPDNDPAGDKALATWKDILGNITSELLIVSPPPGKPVKWDVADAIDEGWDAKRIEAFLATAEPTGRVEVSGDGEAGRGRSDAFTGGEAGDASNGNGFNPTDSGNARRLVATYGHLIRYNADPLRKWFYWDGRRWCEDKTNRIYEFVDMLVRDLYREASETTDDERRKALGKNARALESMSRQKALVAKAETIQSIAVPVEKFDSDNYKFNVLNGTIDLSSGEPVLRPHDPDDYITKIANVVYDPEAKYPQWNKFLEDIYARNEELTQFAQTAAGYSLTGLVSEQCLFFAYGTGQNGKSVFFETLRTLMGEYGGKAPTEMIMQQPFNQVPTDVADLKGKRFVVAAEIEDGKHLAEARVKDLTGGDTITARRMRENFFSFAPTHKLWMYGNHKPGLRGTDKGIRRRIKILPFTVEIPDEKRVKQEVLHEWFGKELSGILNWALEGYMRYMEKGLIEPDVMKDAAEEYFNDMDIIGQFIEECCFVNPNVSYLAKKLWTSYHGWCEDRGVRSVSNIVLNRKLRERGYTVRPASANKMTAYGLALLADEESAAQAGDAE